MAAPTEGSRSKVSGTGGRSSWIERRRLRYKKQPVVSFNEVRGSLRTGDIILFHKTTRSGFIDILELDFVSPILFRANEFRHSGIIVRDGDDILVLECAEEFHSGYSDAAYPTGGRGVRLVSLEALLAAYTRDNGEPHYGVRFISEEIPTSRIYAALSGYGPVSTWRCSGAFRCFSRSTFFRARCAEVCSTLTGMR